MARYIWEVGSENIRNLFETTTMYFNDKEGVLNAIEINPSTYRDYLNEERDSLSVENAYMMLEITSKEPKFGFDDFEEYITVPEDEAWGTGRVELEKRFQQFLFGRELFGPFEEQELEDICGIDRHTYHNYGEDNRSIPLKVYKPFFDFYSQEYDRNFNFEGDIYVSGLEKSQTVAGDVSVDEIDRFVRENYRPDQRFDFHLNGSRERLEKLDQFTEARNLLIDELEEGMRRTRPRNTDMKKVFEELEQEKLVKKIGKPGKLYKILI